MPDAVHAHDLPRPAHRAGLKSDQRAYNRFAGSRHRAQISSACAHPHNGLLYAHRRPHHPNAGSPITLQCGADILPGAAGRSLEIAAEIACTAERMSSQERLMSVYDSPACKVVLRWSSCIGRGRQGCVRGRVENGDRKDRVAKEAEPLR